MHVGPDGFFFFLKTSYVLDMGLIFKLNYRPAKPIFTRKIIHVLLVETTPCWAESLSPGKAAPATSLTHAPSFPSPAPPPRSLQGSQPAPKNRAVLHGKMPRNAHGVGAVLIPWTPTLHCSFISPLHVGIHQLVHRSSLRCPCLWHLPPQQGWCGGLSRFGASLSKLIYWIQHRVELKVSEMHEQRVSFLTRVFSFLKSLKNCVANVETM